jgi:hypothetical protein
LIKIEQLVDILDELKTDGAGLEDCLMLWGELWWQAWELDAPLVVCLPWGVRGVFLLNISFDWWLLLSRFADVFNIVIAMLNKMFK